MFPSPPPFWSEMGDLNRKISMGRPYCTIQFAYDGRTNFVGGIAASRPHRRTDSTVRPTPGTTDVRILVV